MKQLIFDKEDDIWYGDYLKFKNNCYDNNFVYTIINNDEELFGRLEKIRVGRWMSWCLLLEEGCYLSAGCQDEVREMTKTLNGKFKPSQNRWRT